MKIICLIILLMFLVLLYLIFKCYRELKNICCLLCKKQEYDELSEDEKLFQ